MFGYSNPADKAMPYIDQIPGQSAPYLDPYFQQGKNALPVLNNEYSSLMQNPGGRVNQMGQSFQQSPGFKFALDQALQGSRHGAAAGGMAGSPQHEQENMGIATGMANQDYNNWMGHSMHMYDQGLGGEQQFAGMGFHAGQSMADMISQQLAQKADMTYAGQQNDNQENSSFWGNLMQGAGALAGFIPTVGPAISAGLGIFGGGMNNRTSGHSPSRDMPGMR